MRVLHVVASEKWTGAAAVVWDWTQALVGSRRRGAVRVRRGQPLSRRLFRTAGEAPPVAPPRRPRGALGPPPPRRHSRARAVRRGPRAPVARPLPGGAVRPERTAAARPDSPSHRPRPGGIRRPAPSSAVRTPSRSPTARSRAPAGRRALCSSPVVDGALFCARASRRRSSPGSSRFRAELSWPARSARWPPAAATRRRSRPRPRSPGRRSCTSERASARRERRSGRGSRLRGPQPLDGLPGADPAGPLPRDERLSLHGLRIAAGPARDPGSHGLGAARRGAAGAGGRDLVTDGVEGFVAIRTCPG